MRMGTLGCCRRVARERDAFEWNLPPPPRRAAEPGAALRHARHVTRDRDGTAALRVGHIAGVPGLSVFECTLLAADRLKPLEAAATAADVPKYKDANRLRGELVLQRTVREPWGVRQVA